jgi:hypothetical protein
MTRRILASLLLVACGTRPPQTPSEPEPEPESEPSPSPSSPSSQRFADPRPPWFDYPPPEIEPSIRHAPGLEYHGHIDAAEVGARIQNDHARFRACGLRGTAVVRAIVETNGRVSSASFKREDLVGEKECLLRAVKATVFPRPDDAAEVLLPFIFRSRQ